MNTGHTTKKFDLDDRLVDFAVLILELGDALPKSYAGKHLSEQIIRSGTSPALNYGEAQSAESQRDFVHKIKIVLKELRETLACLKIIHRSMLFTKHPRHEEALKENNELVAIFVTSVKTAQSKK